LDDEEEDVICYPMTLRETRRYWEVKKKSTWSHCLANWLLKRLWTWRTKEYVMTKRNCNITYRVMDTWRVCILHRDIIWGGRQSVSDPEWFGPDESTPVPPEWEAAGAPQPACTKQCVFPYPRSHPAGSLVASPLRHAQRTGSSPHFGGTYRPLPVNGTHRQLMECTRLCVKFTQEPRLTGMTNASHTLYDQVPVAYTWQFTDVERGQAHYLPVFTLSPHVWKHGGSKSSWSSLHTPCKFGQCGEKR
jgi:hypothetical protein